MSKQDLVSADVLVGKTLSKYISDTLKGYTSLSHRLHKAACGAVVYTAEFGNVNMLNQLYAGLRTNDRDAFRYWCLRKATVSLFDDEGSPLKNEDGTDQEPVTWLTFSQKEGAFRVKKGTENIRKGLYSFDGLVTATSPKDDGTEVLDSFLNVNTVKEAKKPLDLEKLLSTLLQTVKGFEKKNSSIEEGPKADTKLMGELGHLESMILERQAALKAAKVAA